MVSWKSADVLVFIADGSGESPSYLFSSYSAGWVVRSFTDISSIDLSIKYFLPIIEVNSWILGTSSLGTSMFGLSGSFPPFPFAGGAAFLTFGSAAFFFASSAYLSSSAFFSFSHFFKASYSSLSCAYWVFFSYNYLILSLSFSGNLLNIDKVLYSNSSKKKSI